MKKTTATQKKSKEVDTATEMPEQPETRGTKAGAKRKAKKKDLPKHQKTKKPRTTPEKSLITDLEYLQTRMSPKHFRELLSSLNPAQQQAVQDIGFGSMLTLTVFYWDSRLTRYLLEQFDPYKCSLDLQGDQMRISADDVYSTLELPNGQYHVIEGTSETEPEEYVNLLTEWRHRWEVTKGSPLTRSMPAKMIERGDSGDWFKRDFVIMLVSSLLKGNQSRNAAYKVLYSLADVSRIKDLNWCEYTFKSLIDSAESWKKKPNAYFCGPALFLMLTYLDRLEFKGKKIQRIAPAITSWTEEKVKERIKSEVLSGQFGRGKVIPRFERKEERVHERIDENVQAELSDESLKKVTSVLRKMADTVVEFAEVMAEIGNTRTGGGIIKRTFENIAEMINGVSCSKPPQQQGLLDDDDIFNQPSFLDAVSALEQAFLQTRKNYPAQPAQPTTSHGTTPK
ncbi:uncharacterized protein LOC116033338 [Ipomoea triloba]|uniref:uncharacterized protein LOC116033338 n=1 Tax=Ipomoea triloba TaxID=35885 RepID=UPI00125DC0FE|nr:uncharacterized protein LOC116033338 [Ipomoea triloba]